MLCILGFFGGKCGGWCVLVLFWWFCFFLSFGFVFWVSFKDWNLGLGICF